MHATAFRGKLCTEYVTFLRTKKEGTTIRTTSVTELRDRLAETIDSLSADQAVMVVRHSKPAAYLLSPDMFEKLMERIEDLEDQVDMKSALNDLKKGKAVDAEDVFKRLGK